MIKCSGNQKKATDGPVDLVFVPYEYMKIGPHYGYHVKPDGRSWCGMCHFRDIGGAACTLYHTLRKKVPCRESTRRDQTHGYWKEVKE